MSEASTGASPQPNDLDTLMSYVQEINAKTATEVKPSDINILIAYHRNHRARKAQGFKIPKPEKPKVDLISLLSLSPPPPTRSAPALDSPPSSSSRPRRLP